MSTYQLGCGGLGVCSRGLAFVHTPVIPGEQRTGKHTGRRVRRGGRPEASAFPTRLVKFIRLPCRCHCCSSACRTECLTGRHQTFPGPWKSSRGRRRRVSASPLRASCPIPSVLRPQPLPLQPSAFSSYQKPGLAKTSAAGQGTVLGTEGQR